MAKNTTNYNLVKPDYNDYADINVMNDNMDIIDSKLKEHETKTTELESTVSDCFQSVSSGKELIANAITDKGIDTISNATFATMAENIANIETGIDTSTCTATAETILAGETAGVAGKIITGTMPNLSGQSVGDIINHGDGTDYYTIEVDSEDARMGKLHVNSSRLKGYVDGANTTFDIQLWNLVPSAIASGQVIGQHPQYGSNCITGTFTSDATADATCILNGYTAGINGQMVSGTMPNLGTTPYAGTNAGDSSAFNDTAMASGSASNSSVGAFDLKMKNGYLTAGTPRLHIPNLIPSNILSGVKVGWSNAYIEGTAKSVYTGGATSITNSMNTYLTVSYNGVQNSANNSLVQFTTTSSSYNFIIVEYTTNAGLYSGSFSGLTCEARAFVVNNRSVYYNIYYDSLSVYSMVTLGSISPYYWVTDNGDGTYTHNVAIILSKASTSATIYAF